VEAAQTSGLRAWVLHDDAADLHATWVPQAGMLGASLVHRGEELLWTGKGVGAYVRDRAFMGIPFLHPWANRLAHFGYQAGGREVVLDGGSPLLLLDEHGLPIHGVLTASRRWSASEIGADGDRARLIARLDYERPELLAAFPFPHQLELDIRLGGGALEVQTTVTPTSDEGVPIAFGFHPYLRIPGLPRAEWEVAFPVRRRLLTDPQQIPTGASELVAPISGPIGERVWDDGYDRLDEHRFQLRGGGRSITVEFTAGYPVVQIFAPPKQEYLCVEPMTAPANALSGPGEALSWASRWRPYTATFRIACDARVR
jgi:galactose mutarotase-like enzyme